MAKQLIFDETARRSLKRGVDRLGREIRKHALPDDVGASPRLQPGGGHGRAEILAIEVDGD